MRKPHTKSILIQGVGTNDADYSITNCPYYSVWTGVLYRCFNSKFHAKRPSYQLCTLEEGWKIFSTFRTWMVQQDWEGKELDKDLLVQGNKHYGPDTCVFVSSALNNLLTLRKASQGPYPIGVSVMVCKGKYTYFVASCSFYGKQTRLGYFKTVDEAAAAYKEAKLNYIKELAAKETDPRLKRSLLSIH